jgi:hypothetical protein
MWRPVTAVALLIAVGGCTSTFHETHYFRSSPSGPSIPNYYRLSVDGSSLFSSSRYISGYFDEDTINTYFNEYKQPANAAIVPPSRPPAAATTRTGASSTPTAAARPADTVEPVTGGVVGQKLIMILSSNSDEIATQIGALAQSKQFTAALTGLVARDQFDAAASAESRVAIERARAKATASLVGQIAAGLADDATQAQAVSALLTLADTLAAELGADSRFADLDRAAEWVAANRARILRGDR